MGLYLLLGYKYTWFDGIRLVCGTRSLCVQLKSESTVDAALGLTVVQVDVDLGVTKSTTATVTGNL